MLKVYGEVNEKIHLSDEPSGRQRRLNVTVSTLANASLSTTWDAFVPVSLSEIFASPKGPIPAVIHTSGQMGRWDVVGSSRFVHLSDGSIVIEQIVASNPENGAMPKNGRASFGYRVSGFSRPLGALASEALGTWHFEEVGPNQTRINWQYSFLSKGYIQSLLMKAIIEMYWRDYMKNALNSFRIMSERLNYRKVIPNLYPVGNDY